MLLDQATLTGIADGSIELVFRRWRRPRVRAGTRLRTAIGLVEVVSIAAVDLAEIAERDARRAGHRSAEELRRRLDRFGEGAVYRIAVRFAGEDPRIALRQDSRLDAGEVAAIAAHLDGLDRRSRSGPWTRAALGLIERHPARRAPELAAQLGQETRPFKARVRKLKELGLTESLQVGYRLAPRGRAFVEAERADR